MASAEMSGKNDMSTDEALDFAARLASRPSRYMWVVTVRAHRDETVTATCDGPDDDRVVVRCTLIEWARACFAAAMTVRA